MTNKCRIIHYCVMSHTQQNFSEVIKTITIIYSSINTNKTKKPLIDLEAQLPTRRFAWLTIDATLTLPRVTVAVQRAGKAATQSVFDLVRRQLAALVACHALPIDAFRGVELSQDEVDRQHCAQIQELQVIAFFEVFFFF